MPIFYECQRCTACCRWPGQTRVTDAEITRLANFLELGEDEFIQRYTRLALDRRGLALAEKLTGECIFLEDQACAVHSVKPRMCQGFPNLWNLPGWQKVCQAVPRSVTAEDYERLTGGLRDHPHADAGLPEAERKDCHLPDEPGSMLESAT